MEEKKYGHWVWTNKGINWYQYGWECSECGCRNLNIVANPNNFNWLADPFACRGANFCPECGTPMKPEKKNG